MKSSPRAVAAAVGRPASAALLCGLLFAPGPAAAWGFTAHRMVNAKAIATLPPSLRPLFEANAGYLAEHALDPDLWRTAGHDEETPNHYLDMDGFDTALSALPADEAEHRARYGQKALANGRLPWRVSEVYRELVSAYARRDPALVLQRAAILGHYVGDAHVPLHAILNYDGQLTGQAGVHARWESELVERFRRQIEPGVRPRSAQPPGEPVQRMFEVMAQSFREAPAVLASDLAARGPQDLAETPADDRYGPDYYTTLYEREGERVRERLTASANVLGGLWLQAWQEAGRPALDQSFRFPYVRKAERLILVSLDGSSAPVFDEAVARGVMPRLAKLRQSGATAKGSITALPGKTAAGHAALFTGTYADRNGITGNEVPVPGATILNSVSGYTSTPLLAEPIWAAAARQGLSVSVLSATQVYPFTPYLEGQRFGSNLGSRLLLLDGYQNYDVHEELYTSKELRLTPAIGWRGPLPSHVGGARNFDISVAGGHVDGLVYDDPADPVRGFDTLYLGVNKDPRHGITLKPKSVVPGGGGFQSLVVRVKGGDLGVRFRLFALSPSGSEILLYRAESGVIRSNKPLVETAALKATEGFSGNGGNEYYERGKFGPPLWEGGDGTAERRYLETVRLVTAQFDRLAEFGAENTRWDLLVAYLPFPDELLHTWLGHLDPSLPGHDPALAARLRPFMDEGLRIIDDYVGHLSDLAGPNTVLAVAADHGLIPSDREVNFNVALQKAGLVTLATDGSIDLFRTRAVYFPGNAGYFLLNKVARPQGIVRPEEEAAVLAELAEALKGLRDPETGDAIVAEVLSAEAVRALGGGGPNGGDLYVRLAPRYYPSAHIRGDLVTRTGRRGVHMLDPERPEMFASFTVSGPGVAAGVDLGIIHQIDIAPTLCALLGIDPPAQATGKVLESALARGNIASPAYAPPARR